MGSGEPGNAATAQPVEPVRAADPGILAKMLAQLKGLNLFETLHPQGTGSTRRGYNDIYPSPGK